MTKNPDTTRRLGPSAWRDDWMRPSQTRTQAAREDTMDTPEPARDDLDAFIDERTAADPAFAHHLAAADAAVRASQAAQGPNSPGDDTGATHEPAKPATAGSEPRVHYEIETRFRGRWQTVTAAPDLEEAREFAALSDCGDRIVRITREVIQ